MLDKTDFKEETPAHPERRIEVRRILPYENSRNPVAKIHTIS